MQDAFNAKSLFVMSEHLSGLILGYQSTYGGLELLPFIPPEPDPDEESCF